MVSPDSWSTTAMRNFWRIGSPNCWTTLCWRPKSVAQEDFGHKTLRQTSSLVTLPPCCDQGYSADRHRLMPSADRKRNRNGDRGRCWRWIGRNASTAHLTLEMTVEPRDLMA